MASGLIESLRADMEALREIGAIDEAVLREFDALCPPPAEAPGRNLPCPPVGARFIAPLKEVGRDEILLGYQSVAGDISQ